MLSTPDYKIFSLGDSAITLDYGNRIDDGVNQRVIGLFRSLQKDPLPGMIEAVPAYSSLTVYYDISGLKEKISAGKTIMERMMAELDGRAKQPAQEEQPIPRLIEIPVCYEKEYAPDTEELCNTNNISAGELIRMHTAVNYRVYMLGFLPGFAYMGEVDPLIAIARKTQPRQNVEAGSVGIAGRQTGIYPLASPGGWQIIGRTPLKLFDPAKQEPALLQAGDHVRFFSISHYEFEDHQRRHT